MLDGMDAQDIILLVGSGFITAMLWIMGLRELRRERRREER